MQQTKDNKLSEINNYCKTYSIITENLKSLLGVFDLRYINTLFSRSKVRGVDGKNIFPILFLIRFLDFENVSQLMHSGLSEKLGCKKDVFYDFMKNPRIDWRKVVFLFAKQALKIIREKSEDDGKRQPRCLIVDDSLLIKTGKKIEMIGKVHDHVSHRFHLGMKMLTLGYSDGKGFLPLDFSLHHEPGKKGNRGLNKKELEAQFSKEREEGAPGRERELEMSKDKISMALEMMAHDIGKIDYVLADSWFICEKFIKEIKSFGKGIEVIGLMKSNRKVKIGDRNYRADTVPEVKRKDAKYSSKLKCHYISLPMSYKGIEMRGYWIRMKGQKNWCLLISTDQKDSFLKAMRTYQIRWSIEVFFRDCKQNLNLGGCQSKDLDAQIADISIVLMNYTVLALKKRFEDYETLGEIFRGFKEMMLKKTLVQKIWSLLIGLFDSVFAEFGIDWNAFIRIFIIKRNHILEEIEKNFSELFSSPMQLAEN